jgi:hypothetical protein
MRELEFQRLQLSPYGLQQLDGLISRGAQRMRNSKVDENPGRTLNAEQSLKSLVRYLGDSARHEGTHPHLSGADFDRALRESPTFWPFTSSE